MATLFYIRGCLCAFLIGAVGLFFCGQSFADPQKIYFSGFAFIGAHDDNVTSFEHSREIFDLKDPEKGMPKVNTALIERLKGKSFEDFSLVMDSLGDIRSGNGLAMAFALDWEGVNIEQIDDLFKIVISIHGQILIFDFIDKKIAASYPFGVRINDVTNQLPEKAYICDVFKKIYFGDIGGVNLLEEFIKNLERVKLNESMNRFVKVTEVVIEDRALEFVPAETKAKPSALQSFVAQQFSTFLSSNLNIPVLPSSVGEAIGNTMACRFSNGQIFNLAIPPEDISLKIVLRGFKKVQLDQNTTGSSWAYGTFIQFGAVNAFHETIVNERFKNAAVKIIPASQKTVNDWPVFQESMLSLFDQLTNQIALRESSWIEKKAENKSAENQLKQLDHALRGS